MSQYHKNTSNISYLGAGVLFLGMLFFNNINAQIKLNADGKTDTYKLVSKVLINEKRNAVEVPDCHHTGFGPHITQVFDEVLDKYVFKFDIHIKGDYDRCKRYDRQRNEIKTNKNSNSVVLASKGETIQYKWKFKINKGFKATKKYTSFHQITYNTGKINRPLFVLSARKLNGESYLQVHFIKNGEKEVLGQIPLSTITGKWVCVEEVINYNTNGSYAIVIKTNTQKELLNLKRLNFTTWFDEMVYARPKWGIYRSLKYKKMLRDEVLYFSDIEVHDLTRW